MKILISFLLLLVLFHCTIAFASPSIKPLENSITFHPFKSVTPSKIVIPAHDLVNHHLIEYTKEYPITLPHSLWSNSWVKEYYTPTFIKGSDFSVDNSDNKFLVPSSGFTHSVFEAYRNHHNLIIRPDDVWIAILVQFSFYVNAHPEELRTEFVNFEGKEMLSVTYHTRLYNVPINEFIGDIGKQIEDRIQPIVTNWIMPNFTTTTKEDAVVAGVVLMATLKSYFDYGLTIACGIPEITLLGNVEDWKDIKGRIGQIRKYEVKGEEDHIAEWVHLLEKILDQFIKVKEAGKMEDDTFWKQIIYHYRKTMICGGSTYINGWLTVFSVFDKDGKWQVRSSPTLHGRTGDSCGENKTREKKARMKLVGIQDFNVTGPWPTLDIANLTPGTVQVPVKVTDMYATDMKNGEYNGTLIAGHVGHGVKMDGVTLQPIMGWGLAIVDTVPEYLKKWKESVKNKTEEANGSYQPKI